MDDQYMYLRGICVDRGHALCTDLWVHRRNIRQVVVGTHKWSYKAQMGATGCDRLGVT